jgi:hypothetical protein
MRKILFALAVMSVFLVMNTLAQPEIIRHRVNDQAADNSASPVREFAPTAGSTRKTSTLNYYGGNVIFTPTVYIIWYGNWGQGNGTDDANGQKIVTDWGNSIGSSDYFRINSTYSQRPVSGSANWGGAAAYPGTLNTTSLSDANILTIVSETISKGSLPYNPDGVYLVVTSSNVNESSGFCTNYCGWHTAGTATDGHVRYGFVGNAARCLSSCAAQTLSPNGNAGIDGAISVLSHELEEATTDPDPRTGWVDSRGQENADKCAWTFGTSYKAANGSFANVHMGTRDYLIQRNLWFSGSGWFCAMNSTGGQSYTP